MGCAKALCGGAAGRPVVRSAFTSRDSASEVQDRQSASSAEHAQQPAPPANSASASGAPRAAAAVSSGQQAPAQKPWRLPFLSAFAADEPDQASSSLEEAPHRAKEVPLASSISAEPRTGTAAHSRQAPGQPGSPISSAFAAAEPGGEARPDTVASPPTTEQYPQQQQPAGPGASAFAESAPGHQPAERKTRPHLVSAFASDSPADDASRQQQSRKAAPETAANGSATGAAEDIELSERGGSKPDLAASDARKTAPQLVKSPFNQDG